jgi:hypothetical protein
MSLIAFPSLWLGALAGLAGTWTVPSFNWSYFRSSCRISSTVPKPSFCVIGSRTLHDRSVQDVAAIDHQQLTGHEVRGVRQEEDHRSDQIVGLLVAFDEPAVHVSLMTLLGHP